MVDEVKDICSNDFAAILSDGRLTLLLLSVYSKLYMSGNPPSTCQACMKKMYAKIISTGLKKATEMENKTCKMRKGIVYVRQIHAHVSDNNITDEKAIEYLNKGYLLERHFEIMPKDYKAQGNDPKPVEKIVLSKENKGKFTKENLSELNGNSLISYAGGLTGEKPQNKRHAVEMILEWQDK